MQSSAVFNLKPLVGGVKAKLDSGLVIDSRVTINSGIYDKYDDKEMRHENITLHYLYILDYGIYPEYLKNKKFYIAVSTDFQILRG